MNQIIPEFKSCPEHEQKYIYDQTVQKLTGGNQKHGQLDVIIIKDFVEKAAQIPDLHIHQGIESKQVSVEDIYHKAAEKTNQHPLLLSSHKADGGGQDNQKIRTDGCQCKRLKYRILKNKANNN